MAYVAKLESQSAATDDALCCVVPVEVREQTLLGKGGARDRPLIDGQSP